MYVCVYNNYSFIILLFIHVCLSYYNCYFVSSSVKALHVLMKILTLKLHNSNMFWYNIVEISSVQKLFWYNSK